MNKIEDEHVLFEAAGAKLHGWGELDYRRPSTWDNKPTGEYTWLEVRRAFALWLEAKGIEPC